MSAPRLLLTTAYDGTAFSGWQVQPGKRTVQGEIESALSGLANNAEVRIHASGRTDTGVHARGQTFHFDPPRPDFSCDQWVRALNGTLPDDIRILRARPVPETFHARFDVLRKEYRYFLFHGPVMPPELRFTRLHVRPGLNPDAIRAACALLTGEHDFRAFSAIRDNPGENTVRRLDTLELLTGDDLWTLRAVAGGFLYRMVRQLTGTLLRVGRGELTPEDVARLLEAKERTPATVSAPPHGLFLWHVTYPDTESSSAATSTTSPVFVNKS